MAEKWRNLPPVEKAVAIEPEEGVRRVSQTFLRTHDRCDRSAYLSLLHEGGVGSHEMNRGSIFHRFAERATRELIEADERKLPPERGKDLLIEVLEEFPDLTVPAAERDSLRAMVFNWCEGTFFDPQTIIGVEQSVHLRLGDWEVRCRIDLAEMPYYGRIDVTDYKTAFAMPTESEWSGDFQTELYALCLAFGETDEGIPLGADAQEFGLRLVFPRYLRDDGLAFRFARRTRQELVDLRLDVEHQLRRLEANLETQRWPATPGAHCSECVSPVECPLPRHLRPDSQMALADLDDARKLAEWWEVTTAQTKRAKARLKAWADRHGQRSIPIGRDLELVFVHGTRSGDLDREAFAAEVEAAMEFGHPVDLDKLRRRTDSVTFERRKVKPLDPKGETDGK